MLLRRLCNLLREVVGVLFSLYACPVNWGTGGDGWVQDTANDVLYLLYYFIFFITIVDTLFAVLVVAIL